MLDNTGHEHTERPKGTGAKLDAVPVVYKVVTTEPFSPEQLGKLTVTCTRSRYGDVGREWTMRVGGGGRFDVPTPVDDESPNARRARRLREDRERFRLVAIEVLREEQPQGAKRIAAGVRERGYRRRLETLRQWLQEFAADPTSGIVHVEDGYEIKGGSQ
jgi:hypothetical protein